MTGVLLEAAALALFGCAALMKGWRFRQGRAPELGDSRLAYLLLPTGAAFLAGAATVLAEGLVDESATSDPGAPPGLLTAALVIVAILCAVVRPRFLAPRPDKELSSRPVHARAANAAAEPAPRPESPIKTSELRPAWQNRVWHRALTWAFLTSVLISIALSIFWFHDFDEYTDASDLRVFAVIFALLWPLFWIVLARRQRRRTRDVQAGDARRR